MHVQLHVLILHILELKLSPSSAIKLLHVEDHILSNVRQDIDSHEVQMVHSLQYLKAYQ